MTSRITDKLASLYDWLNLERNRETLEHFFVRIAVISFVSHLIAIFFVRIFPELANGPLAGVGTNFLQAVYTPFSFILFFEVILLVLAIPSSLTTSIGKQYEIISLIVIRRVFKDVGSFEDMDSWLNQPEAVKVVLLDMGGAMLMFIAVTLFYWVRKYTRKTIAVEGVKEFVQFKKAVALVLGSVLLCLASYNVICWFSLHFISAEKPDSFLAGADDFFFPAFFEFMIFTDVLILIVSICYYDRYEYLFRNSGFVISTVLLRISLSTSKPYDLAVGIVAILYGLLLITVFTFFSRINENQPAEAHDLAESSPDSQGQDV
ncbi:MAG: hypothetical protein AAF939_07210 [Planctomycetota bacterium]